MGEKQKEKEITLDEFLKNPKMYKDMEDDQLKRLMVSLTEQALQEDCPKEKVKELRKILKVIDNDKEKSGEVRKTARICRDQLGSELEVMGALPVRKNPKGTYDESKAFREEFERIMHRPPILHPEEKHTLEEVGGREVLAIQDTDNNGFLPADGSVSLAEFGELWTTALMDGDEKNRENATKQLGGILGGSGFQKLENEIGTAAANKMVKYLKAGKLDEAMKVYDEGYSQKWGHDAKDDASLGSYHGKVKKEGYILERTTDGLQVWRGRVGIQFVFPEGEERLREELMRRTESGWIVQVLGFSMAAIDGFLTYNEKVVKIDYSGTTETKSKKAKELNKEWYEYGAIEAAMAVGKNGLIGVFQVHVEKNQQSLKISPLARKEKGGAGSPDMPLIPWFAEFKSVEFIHGQLGPNAKQQDYWDIHLTIGDQTESWRFMNLGYEITFKMLALGVQGETYANFNLGGGFSLTASFMLSSDKFNELLYGPGLGIDWDIYKGWGITAGATALFSPKAKPGEAESEVSGSLFFKIPIERLWKTED